MPEPTASLSTKPETKRQRLEVMRAQLLNERTSFLEHWREVSDHVFPRRSRFSTTDVNKGDKRNQKIIDSTATLAARTLRSGMMAGITSPARPWFRLTTPDQKMAEVGAVKDWLYGVSQRMNYYFLKSNLYRVLPIVYGDIGVFGTSAMFIEENFNGRLFHCYSFPVGSYCIATNSLGQVDTFTRDFRMTVRQLVQHFGIKDQKGKIQNWQNFSDYVKNAYESGQLEQWIDVVHVVCPNEDYNLNYLAAKYKKFSSCYYEVGSTNGSSGRYMQKDDTFLAETGYDEFPILAPRWEVTGEDIYGTECPGMSALADVKQLQFGEKKAAQAIEKMVNPPMSAPTSLSRQKASTLPGDITYLDVREGQQGFRPVHEVNPRIQELEGKQEQVRMRIKRAFYEDLFRSIIDTDRRQITAREIDARESEKLTVLGPVLEQLNQDLLDPLIDNAFNFMVNQRLIDRPPRELEGVPLKVEYISILSQAQKMVGIGGIERFSGFVGQLAGINPEVLDKVDTDQIVDIYGETVSVPPGIIRSDDRVEEIRAQRAQAQQKAMAEQKAAELAGAAKTLSETSLEGDNALSRVLGG